MHDTPLEIIAKVHGPYREKFGIPRQPRLAPAAVCDLVFEDKFNDPNYVAGLTQHSHIWLLFRFHENLEQGYKPQVRPPRLGGNNKMGVFATRATFRPNGIGMSAVKLLAVSHHNGRLALKVQGADLVNGTPIVDIKPYIPYSDIVPEASSELAQQAEPEQLSVVFSESAEAVLTTLDTAKYPDIKALIDQVLAQDPRPAYKKDKIDVKEYGIRLYDLNIKWRVEDAQCKVLSIDMESAG